MSMNKRIEEICDRFESAWNSGEEPNIVTFAGEFEGQHRTQLIQALIPVDVKCRLQAQLQVGPADYERFGAKALRIAEQEIKALSSAASQFAETMVGKEQVGTNVDDEAEGAATLLDTIGPYKILQPIGKGGMGQVFMAEQTDPVKRRVALKIIKTDTPTKEILARFEAERQALAMMDHQNIAKYGRPSSVTPASRTLAMFW